MNIQQFWSDVLAQRADEIREYFHADAYVNWHCSNEHFTVEEFIRANCEYPGDWDGEIEKIVTTDDMVITATRVYPKDRSASFHVTSFIKLKDDKIVAMDEYWANDGEAPTWRQDMNIGRKINEPIAFVLAAECDANAIVELRQKIWATTYRGIYPDQMIDEFDSAWHIEKELQRIRHPDYREYLIVRDGRQIGYLITRKKDEVALQSLYVLKEHQRQGVGTAAFAFVQRYCTENGSASFVCQCVPENWNARRFYERMGGKIIGEDIENEERWQNSVTYRFDVGQ